MSVSKKLNKQRFLKSIAREIKQSYHDLVSILTPKKKNSESIENKVDFRGGCSNTRYLNLTQRAVYQSDSTRLSRVVARSHSESWQLDADLIIAFVTRTRFKLVSQYPRPPRCLDLSSIEVKLKV